MALDPRSTGAAAGRSDAGIRPVVAPPPRGASTLMIGGGVVAAGVALFLLLNGHRQAIEAPAVRASAAERAAAGPAVPSPLYVPPLPPPPPPAVVEAPPAIVPPPPPPRIVYVPQPAPAGPAEAPPPSRRGSDAAALVIDTTVADGVAPAGPADTDAGNAGGVARGNATSATGSPTTAAFGARARAIMLADRGTTVPQGTLIPAVLETAFDSTRPGLARALVSRDVRGFDGSRILIPRGSRLTGEYRSDAASGQNRALIIWTTLTRPDGATVAIASPVADTLGRGGAKAHVNTHFLARFTGAILQSALAVGVNLASRAGNPNGNGTYVLGLPGSTVGAVPQFNPNAQVTNTLTVRAGTSIGVFVSRDLDFAGVEGRR